MPLQSSIWDIEPTVDRLIDLSKCKTLGELHTTIKEVLELPDWYGENLDALWDSIIGLMHLPANIVIKKSGKGELSSYVDKVISIFLEAEDMDAMEVMLHHIAEYLENH